MERREYMSMKGELITAKEEAVAASSKLHGLWLDLQNITSPGRNGGRFLQSADFKKAKQLLDDIEHWQSVKKECEEREHHFTAQLRDVQPPA
ncbi:MAG: hypothetical protein LBE75_06405 [Burkholderiales bacterium]|nr:hypothetical protein [Burkholderiales bacterium]